MKVLQIGVLPLWEDRGDSIHLREMAFALKERGVEMRSLTLPSREGARGDLANPTVRVLDFRFLRQLSWNVLGTIAAVREIRQHRVDWVYSRLDPGMYAGWAAATLCRVPLAVEINGLIVEDVRLYRPHNRILLAMTRNYERMMFSAARLIVGSTGYSRYYGKRNPGLADRIVAAPLGVNTRLYKPASRRECRAELGLPERPTVVWIGTLSGLQGLDTLVGAAGRMAAELPDVNVLIVGSGPRSEVLRERIKEIGIERNCELVGPVPYTRTGRYIGAADVCVGTFPGERGEPGVISSLKILNYLASGRPVVTTAMDELGPEIAECGAGSCVEPDDESALATAILDVLRLPSSGWNAASVAARRLGVERDWSRKAEIVHQELEARQGAGGT